MWGSPPCIPLVLAAAWGVLGGFSPDGSLIAAGDGDPFANDKTGTIRLYSTATGDPFGSPLKVDYRVLCLSYAPNGDILAVGDSGGNINFFNAKGEKTLSPVRGHRDAPSLSKECFLSFG